MLLWLVLFKLSLDVPSVLDYQMRSLNLIPFAGFSRGNSRQMIDNLVVFIPLGLLLSVNIKRANLWRKLAFVFFNSGITRLVRSESTNREHVYSRFVLG
jgi:glycopeptide antibiotics resistance protein